MHAAAAAAAAGMWRYVKRHVAQDVPPVVLVYLRLFTWRVNGWYFDHVQDVFLTVFLDLLLRRRMHIAQANTVLSTSSERLARMLLIDVELENNRHMVQSDSNGRMTQDVPPAVLAYLLFFMRRVNERYIDHIQGVFLALSLDLLLRRMFYTAQANTMPPTSSERLARMLLIDVELGNNRHVAQVDGCVSGFAD